MPPQQAQAWIASLSEKEALALQYDWEFWARNDQLMPEGNWFTWLALAGRGWGKTRAGSQFVLRMKSAGVERIALVAETAADARDVMVEGESGIMACSPPWDKPIYEPSKRRITWKNGTIATTYSGDSPDQLRGPQHGAAWVDELAKFQYADETWDNLQFGLRLGDRPRQMVTTTPRPIPILRQIMAAKSTHITRGRTYDNIENLSSNFREIIQRYEGTRLGRQELNAEMLDDVVGALWTRSMIEAARSMRRDDDGKLILPDMRRVVVAVDPSGSAGDDGGDSQGIVVVGKGVDGKAYVLADRTCNLSPDGWARRAVDAYREFNADRIVAERNYGGAMVEHVIKTVDSSVSYKEVTASRGKVQRAEPIAALYEQGKVKHAANTPELEDQMCQMTGEGYLGGGSPDRVDALVWGVTELMLNDGFVVSREIEF